MNIYDRIGDALLIARTLGLAHMIVLSEDDARQFYRDCPTATVSTTVDRCPVSVGSPALRTSGIVRTGYGPSIEFVVL